jgi:hypothetical protein
MLIMNLIFLTFIDVLNFHTEQNIIKTQQCAESSCATAVSSKADFSEETVSEEHRNLASEWMHEVVIDSKVQPEVCFSIIAKLETAKISV